MSDIITVRDIEMVTSDIRYAQRQGARQLLSNLIEIGRLLVEAKSIVPHGEWGKYLEEQVDYSQATANNYMKLYQEYGSSQESFFDSIEKSQTFGNLTYTQALALLALPAEQRQEFAEENNVAEMSTRQLEQAIRERNEERAAREQAEANAAKFESAAKIAKESEDNLRQIAGQANAEKTAAAEKVEKLKKQLEKAQQNEKAAKDALAKAQKNPEIPEAVMESLRQQVAADAAREATEKLQQELDAANKAKDAAERNAEQAEQKLVAAQKALQLSSPDAAVFKTLFEQVQKDFERMLESLKNVRQTDAVTGEKLHGAVRRLLSKLIDDLEEV